MARELNKNTTTELGIRLFYIAYIIILVKSLIGYSTLSAYIPTRGFVGKYVIRLVVYLIILYKLFTQDRFDKQTCFYYAAFLVIICLGMFISKNFAMLDLAIIVIGANGIRLKNIVKLFFCTAAVATGLFLLMSLCGIIENYTTYKEDGTPRYAFGNIYATDFAAMIFYLQISLAFIRKKRYGFVTFAIWCVIAALIYMFCGARLDTVLILTFNVAMLLYAKFPKLFDLKIARILLSFSMIIFCIIAVLLHVKYSSDSSFLSSLNSLLSGRLGLGKQAIDKYGFSLFGKDIEMQGLGFTTGELDTKVEYFFIDCGYLNISLCNGILYLLVLLLCFTCVTVREVKRKNYLLPIIIFFLAISSVIDHHLNQLTYNPFLFVIGVAMQNAVELKRTKKKVAKRSLA